MSHLGHRTILRRNFLLLEEQMLSLKNLILLRRNADMKIQLALKVYQSTIKKYLRGFQL